MATTAHGLYCFEVLTAALEKRSYLSLQQVQDLWDQYEKQAGSAPEKPDEEGEGMSQADGDPDLSDDLEELESDGEEPRRPTPSMLQPPSISRLQASASPASASTASSPSSLSTSSSKATLHDSSKSSSNSSFFSLGRHSQQSSPVSREEKHPLFVTWNTVSSGGRRSLRGCIGTFDARELSAGLASYALTAAFDDTRFSPITLSELPSLATAVTLLTNFTPALHPDDWELGTHGIRLSFSHHGKRYGATYLPDVAVEQGWTKEQTIVSLMRKAGWVGRSADWRKVQDLRIVKYQGQKLGVDYDEFREWRNWIGAGR